MCISFYEPSRKRPITLRGSQVTLEVWAHSMEPASCHLSGRLKFGGGAYTLENRRSSFQAPSNEGIRTCTHARARTHTLLLAFSNPFTVVSFSSSTRLRLSLPQRGACIILWEVSHPGTLRQWKSDARASIECHEETYTCHLVKLLASDTARCKNIAVCLSVCRDVSRSHLLHDSNTR